MFISNKPLIAEINDGAENVSLNGKNDTTALQTKAFPWNDYAVKSSIIQQITA